MSVQQGAPEAIQRSVVAVSGMDFAIEEVGGSAPTTVASANAW